MNPRRIRFNVTSLLLTSTALLTMAALPFAAHAAPLNGPFVVAQAAAPDARQAQTAAGCSAEAAGRRRRPK